MPTKTNKQDKNQLVTSDIIVDNNFTQIHIGVEYSYPVGNYEQVKSLTNITKRISGEIEDAKLKEIIATIVELATKVNEYELNKRILERKKTVENIKNE